MLALAIAAVTVLLVGASVSWLKRMGRLSPLAAVFVGAGAVVFLTVAIVLVALLAPQEFGGNPSRGVGEIPEPTKVIDVQLPTL